MKRYVPTNKMPKYYNLLDMIKAGLDSALVVDMLIFDKSLPMRIRVNEYNYDSPVIKALLSLGWIEEPRSELLKEEGEKTYRIGQKFLCDEGGNYILSQVSPNHVTLVSLNDGNRWNDPQEVKDISAITVDEMLDITLGESFTLIAECEHS